MKLYNIFVIFVLVFTYNSKIYANNILNCPSCNLDRNLCKNCNAKPNNQKPMSSQIEPEKSNQKLTWCAQDWVSKKDSLWHFPYWVRNKNQCTHNIISEEEAINKIKKSDVFSERLCDFVSGNITEYLKPYFDLANKYNFNCTDFSSTQFKSNVNTNKITPKTKDAEDKCAEIGFKKGTEKYGDCVLKMLELK